MTIRAIAGIAGLNVFFMVVGSALLWGIRGWRSWAEVVRLSGVAYLLGIAALSIVLTSGLVAGIPFGPVTLLVAGSSIAAGGIVIGMARGQVFPSLRPSRPRLPGLSIPGALFGAALILYFEALFRAARLLGPGEWDAWFVWTIRAKALYHGGDLGGDVLIHEGYSAYPPALSLLHAAGFEAMGSTDAVTLHTQHWFLALGFAVALVGVLSERVRPIVLFPFVISALTMPIFLDWAVILYADLLLAFQAGVALLLLAMWIDDRARWRLLTASVLLGGALLTKREGVIVAACIIGACCLASWNDRRQVWPWLLGAFVVAIALTLPWWTVATGVEQASPSTGTFGFVGTTERIWPSFKLVGDVFIDYCFSSGMAILAVVVVVGLAGARRLSVLMISFACLSIIAATAIIASEPLFAFSRDEGINPVERLVMVLVVALIPLAPLVVEGSLNHVRRMSPSSATNAGPRRAEHSRLRLAGPWVLVSVVLIAYPASMLAGVSALTLPGGAP